MPDHARSSADVVRRWTIPVGRLACNCSIVADPASGDCLVIDPGDDTESEGQGGLGQILDCLRDNHLHVAAIAITHAHIDHIGAAARLKRLTGAPLLLQPRDQEIYGMLEDQAGWLGIPLPATASVDAPLRDNEPVRAGGMRFDVLETPGHTPGSACLYLASAGQLFAGDTLFAGSIGRTDLPGGDMAQIVHSVHSKLLVLPDATLVIPGHGRETTIGAERATNPFLTGRRAQFR